MMRILLLFLFIAPLVRAEEIIHSFHSRIEVATNAQLTVTETIRVRAEGQSIKRGIYRDFPQLYRGKWGLRQKTGFEVVSVLRDGKPEPWHSEKRSNGQRIYIGDANVLLNEGDYTYTLTYTTDRQLGFFDTHDELYWNVTGNGWEFAMQQVTAEVWLPEGVHIQSREAYTGYAGSKGQDYITEAPIEHIALFATTRPLAATEGLTIVVTWPKGAVFPAMQPDDPMVMMRDNPGLAMGLIGLGLVFIYYVVVWSLFGRDPERGTIIPRYEPPEGFSPAAVRVMTRMKFDPKAFAANLIQLGVKGALVLQEAGGEYTVTKAERTPTTLLPDERALHSALFGIQPTLAFKQKNHARISSAQSAMRGNVMQKLEKSHFVKNAGLWGFGILFTLIPLAVSLIDAREIGGAVFMTIWLSIWSLGVTALVSSAVSQLRARSYGGGLFLLLFSIPFIGGELFGLYALIQSTSYWVAGLFLLGIILNGVFFHLLKAPTRLGRDALDKIEGFKRYLTVAERDRLNFENPPAKTPELFDKFLPYALALDVEQEWAEQFTDVLANAAAATSTGYSPVWYRGRAVAVTGFSTFATSLGSSLSGAISASSHAPGSSSGSSSGGGGGGSSGGGGGGGGGGGW